MKDVNDLRRERKAAADEMGVTATALDDLRTAGTDGDAEEMVAAVAAFEAAETSFKAADDAVKLAEAVENAQATSAISETEDLGAPAPAPAATAKDPEMKGVEFGFMVSALANADGDKARAAKRLEDDGHSAISAALSGAVDVAGGVTIPRAQAQDVIELLRPRVTVIASGARVIDMPAGQVRHARQATSATAGYGAENSPSVESEPTFDSIDRAFKKLTALVPIGNSLIRNSSASMAQLVRDDMLDVMGLRKDLAFLRGDGSNNTPTGMGGWVLPSNVQTAIGVGAAAVEQALRRMISQVQDADVAMVRPGWIMRASTRNFLASLREPNLGSYMFPSIDQSNTLLGYPIQTTSQLPDNLGGNGNETEVFFADFNEMMIGDSMSLMIGTSGEAAYVNTNGDTVSSYQDDLTLMRAIEEHDFAPRHSEAIAQLTGAGWSL